MILYHYTAAEYLDSIKTHGILPRGDVPFAATPHKKDFAATWLTTDLDPSGHGLTDGYIMNASQIVAWKKLQPGRTPAGIVADKRCIRITVDVEGAVWWNPWAAKNINAKWKKQFVEIGGGMKKAATWYFVTETISPDKFVDIEHLRESRTPKRQ